MKAICADFLWVLPAMSTIDRQTGYYRRPTGRIRPNFDRLESRLALSGTGGLTLDLSSGLSGPGVQEASVALANSPIVAVDPATTSVLEHSPTNLTITFARPIDPFSVGNADFELVHVASDGSTSPLSPSESGLLEAADPSDPSGTRIVLTLDGSLADGRYRLLLRSDNLLQTADGQAVSTGGAAFEVSTFTVGTPGHGLADAVDLGVAGPNVSVRSDVLDLSVKPGDFKLYKLTVPAGHFWRLGLAVQSLSSTDRLDSTVSLFDAQGHLIATNSMGRPGSIGDPYLFHGVSAGTYYVGVSGKGNVPGQSGGYDPVTGASGASGIAQDGGAFRLGFVADPADRATRVLGLKLDRSDPYSSVPTGLTIQFSGPIAIADLLKSGQSAMTLVDDSGKSWSLEPLRYNESRAQLSFIFDQALPAGHYTLVVPPGSPLVDLAGLVPTAAGQPAGVLGAFPVLQGKTLAGDLGAVFPGAGAASTPVTISSGGLSVEHLTVLKPGYYSIDGATGSSGLSLQVRRADGSSVSLPPANEGSAKVDVFLAPGTYSLILTDRGVRAVAGTVTVSLKQSLLDSLLLGGVAQGPALSLRLIAPTLSIDGGTSGPNSSPSGLDPQASPGSSAGSGSSASPSLARESSSTQGVASGSIPLYTGGLVGRPTAITETISVVGPSGPSGSVALASNSEGLPRGIVGIPSRAGRGGSGEGRRHLDARPTEVPTAPSGAWAEVDYGLISRDRDRGMDDRVLSEAGWIDRIAALSLERLEFLTGRAASWTTGAEGLAIEVPGDLEAEGIPPSLESPRVEVASIAPSVGLGVLAMLAYRNRQRILGSLTQGRKVEPKPSQRTLYSGPHRGLLRVLR